MGNSNKSSLRKTQSVPDTQKLALDAPVFDKRKSVSQLRLNQPNEKPGKSGKAGKKQKQHNSEEIPQLAPSDAAFLPEFPLRGELEDEDFHVLGVIARGAYGNVIKVQREDKKQFYAVKVLDKAQIIEEGAIRQCKDEATIQSMAGEHFFVVKAHEYWQSSGNLYIVLDYVPHGDMFTLWTFHGAFPEKLVQVYIAEMAMVIDFLHNASVIYRDVKMENILFNAKGHIQLTDFGLAKWLQGGDQTRTVCGTLQYMAPEVLSVYPYSHSADWWSLGILMYAMLAGRYPVDGADTHTKMAQKVFECDFLLPSDISDLAQDVINNLLTKSPHKRMCDVNSLQDLEFFQDMFFSDLIEQKINPVNVVPEDFFPMTGHSWAPQLLTPEEQSDFDQFDGNNDNFSDDHGDLHPSHYRQSGPKHHPDPVVRLQPSQPHLNGRHHSSPSGQSVHQHLPGDKQYGHQQQPGEKHLPGDKQYGHQQQPGEKHLPGDKQYGHQQQPGEKHLPGDKQYGHQQQPGEKHLPGDKQYGHQQQPGEKHLPGDKQYGHQQQPGEKHLPGDKQYGHQQQPGEKHLPGDKQYGHQQQPGEKHLPGDKQYGHQQQPGEKQYPGDKQDSHQQHPGVKQYGHQNHPGEKQYGHQNHPGEKQYGHQKHSGEKQQSHQQPLGDKQHDHQQPAGEKQYSHQHQQRPQDHKKPFADFPRPVSATGHNPGQMDVNVRSDASSSDRRRDFIFNLNAKKVVNKGNRQADVQQTRHDSLDNLLQQNNVDAGCDNDFSRINGSSEHITRSNSISDRKSSGIDSGYSDASRRINNDLRSAYSSTALNSVNPRAENANRVSAEYKTVEAPPTMTLKTMVPASSILPKTNENYTSYGSQPNLGNCRLSGSAPQNFGVDAQSFGSAASSHKSDYSVQEQNSRIHPHSKGTGVSGDSRVVDWGYKTFEVAPTITLPSPQISFSQNPSLPQNNILQPSLPRSNILQSSLPQSNILQSSSPQSNNLQSSLPQNNILQSTLPHSNILQPSLPESNNLQPSMTLNNLQRPQPASSHITFPSSTPASSSFASTNYGPSEQAAVTLNNASQINITTQRPAVPAKPVPAQRPPVPTKPAVPAKPIPAPRRSLRLKPHSRAGHVSETQARSTAHQDQNSSLAGVSYPYPFSASHGQHVTPQLQNQSGANDPSLSPQDWRQTLQPQNQTVMNDPSFDLQDWRNTAQPSVDESRSRSGSTSYSRREPASGSPGVDSEKFEWNLPMGARPSFV